MSEWTEKTLRAAASWQAFKTGKNLLETGAVEEVRKGSTGWKGIVREGRRSFRINVIFRSVTDLEAHCSCPENQASGSICAHAIATGLATLQPPSVSKPPGEPPLIHKTAYGAFEWEIPPNWERSIISGKIFLNVSESEDKNFIYDKKIIDWLVSHHAVGKGASLLQLEGEKAGELLALLIGQPGIPIAGTPAQLEIGESARWPLAQIRREGECVILHRNPQADAVLLGTQLWVIGERRLSRAGRGPLPAELQSTVFRLLAEGSSRMALRTFLAHVDAWQEWLEFPEEEWLDRLHFIPAEPRFHLHLDGSPVRPRARLGVSYGQERELPPPGLGEVHALPMLEGDQCLVRNWKEERNQLERLLAWGFREEETGKGEFSLSGEEALMAFLAHRLSSLEETWNVTLSPQLEAIRRQLIVVRPKIRIQSQDSQKTHFTYSYETEGGTEIPRAEIQRLLRSGGRYRSKSGKTIVLDSEIPEVWEPLLEELQATQQGDAFIANAAVGELLSKSNENDSNLLDKDDLENLLRNINIKADLRDYQREGAGWLWDRIRRFGGGLLADDMGLGKTLQAITVIEKLFQTVESSGGPNRILVVATASLLGNWQREFQRFAPHRVAKSLHGANREKEREGLGDGEVLLTSYGTLARDLAWHLKQEYLAVVVDEASLMRNPDTDHAKAISKLRARYRIALTGTPLENGVRDLWSIFRFIQPGWLGSREQFKERYEAPLAEGEGTAAVMKRLRLKVSPFLLRRTKEEVAPELPGKLFIDEWCELTPDQQKVYRELMIEGRKSAEALEDGGNSGAARMRMLTALLRLRQTCCDLALLGGERFPALPLAKRSGKLVRLLELLEEAISGGHRVLVFSQFQMQLVEIEKAIAERGWSSLRLDGQTRNRQERVDRFQAEDGPPVFLISLKAGGYGLNLTAADTVIHFDPWWNPAAEAQATDRAHRIGQTRPVTVYRMLTRGTVEENVVRMQTEKRTLAAAIDEEGGGDAPNWSAREWVKTLNG